MLNYVYTAVWLLAGIILAIRFRKENKAIARCSIFFFIFAAWWGGNIYTKSEMGINLFEGTYLWIFRVIALIAIICFGVILYKERKSVETTNEEEGKK